MGAMFKGIDMFGSPVKLTYQKGFAYTTKFGASGTLIMYILLAVYAIEGLIRVVTNDPKSILTNEKKLDIMTYEGFSPGNATYGKKPGFNLAFGTELELDKKYGSWKVDHTTKTREKGKKKVNKN
jgi:hypothetical protein